MKEEKKEAVEQKISKLAIVSFVLGILNIIIILITIVSLWYLPRPILIMYLLSPLIALCSILLGIIGLVKILRNSLLKGKWFCILGILLGIIVLYLVYYIYVKTTEAWVTGF